MQSLEYEINTLFHFKWTDSLYLSWAVLAGEGLSAVVGQFDRLLQLKRQAAEIHIRCIAQVRQILPADQYSQLLALTREARP